MKRSPTFFPVVVLGAALIAREIATFLRFRFLLFVTHLLRYDCHSFFEDTSTEVR